MILKSCSRPGSKCKRLSVFVGGFGLVAQAFDAFRDFDERAECGYAQDFAVDHIADVVGLEEGLPDIGLKLLYSERQAPLIRFDGENDCFHAVALFQYFRRMLHALGPAQVADVDQAVDAVFDFDEGAEVGEVAHASFDRHADGEFLVERIPRIGRQLAHAERNAALGWIHVENHALDLIANVDELRRMLHTLRPRHFADVNQAFDSLLEFHERTVVSDADDASAYVRALGITMLGIEPRIGRELLESQRNALLVFVVLENLNLNLIADVDQIFGVSEASPGHVGDVQQAVEAAEIDERAVFGEVLDHSGEHRTFFQVLERLGALFVLLAFEQILTRHDDVAALLVQLDDGDFERLALHAVQIADGTKVDLRARQESVGAENVDGQAAFNAVDDDGLDGLLFVVGFLDFFPGVNALRLLVREVDVAFLGLALVAHHVDFVAGLELGLALVIEHFRQRQHAFRLGADVDYHVRGGQLQHRAFDDAVFADGLFGFGGEGLQHGGEVFGGADLSSPAESAMLCRRNRRCVGVGRRSEFGLVQLFCRRFFSDNSGGGFGVVGGGFVEQGYASLMTGCGACVADCWTSRLVVVGPPWRVSLDNPSCRTFYREPASNGNSSTIATAREQCQTQIGPECYRACFSVRRAERRISFGFPRASANLPCYGLSLDAVALCLCFVHGKDRRMRVLRRAEGEGRCQDVYIVHRGVHCFVILNAYPYTPGHVMIVPYAHLDELRKLPVEAANEMMALSQRMESVLRELYHPDGINLGMNIGKAAGAGIAGHIHMHVLPRWVADANFVSVVGETRVLPETLDVTWGRMREAMK